MFLISHSDAKTFSLHISTMTAGLIGSSKLAKKTVSMQPYKPPSVQMYAPVEGRIQKNANRQNLLNNGGILAAARKTTEQSGGAFFLEHAKSATSAKSPSTTDTKTPPTKSSISTSNSTQGVVVVPQFRKNSRTPVSSTAIAEQSIKAQYKQQVQSSTDSGAQVSTLGNEQKSGGRRKKKRTQRKKRGRTRNRRSRHRRRSRRTR